MFSFKNLEEYYCIQAFYSFSIELIFKNFVCVCLCKFKVKSSLGVIAAGQVQILDVHVSLAKVSYEFAHYIHLWIGNARIIN